MDGLMDEIPATQCLPTVAQREACAVHPDLPWKGHRCNGGADCKVQKVPAPGQPQGGAMGTLCRALPMAPNTLSFVLSFLRSTIIQLRSLAESMPRFPLADFVAQLRLCRAN